MRAKAAIEARRSSMNIARKLLASCKWHLQRLLYAEPTIRRAAYSLLPLGIGWTTWQLLLALWAQPNSQGTTSSSALTSAAVPAATNRGERIADLHLFGKAAPESWPLIPIADATVAGIAYTGDAGPSLAILAIDGIQRSYTVGDALPNGERLVGIEHDQVIFERNGIRHRLNLEIKQADPNADFRPVELGIGTVNSKSEDAATPAKVSAGNSGDVAVRLQAFRQNLTSPPDALAGKRTGAAIRDRPVRRGRITQSARD